MSAIKMRQARTSAAAAPAITNAARSSGAGTGNYGDPVQFVFVGATTSKAVAAARLRYAPNCIVTQPVSGGSIASSVRSDEAAPVVNPLLQHKFVTVDGNGDKLQVKLRFSAPTATTYTRQLVTRNVCCAGHVIRT